MHNFLVVLVTTSLISLILWVVHLLRKLEAAEAELGTYKRAVERLTHDRLHLARWLRFSLREHEKAPDLDCLAQAILDAAFAEESTRQHFAN